MSFKNDAVRVAIRAMDPDKDATVDSTEDAWFLFDKEIHVKNDIITNDKYPMQFDHVFDLDATNKAVYDEAVAPLIFDVTKGYNGTLFVCGPSFAGKQFTMEDIFHDVGMIPRAIEQIFKSASKEKKRGNYIIRCSNFMIHKDKIYDLLKYGNKEVNVINVDNGKVTIGAKEAVISSKSQAFDLFQLGLVNRDMYLSHGEIVTTNCDMIFRMIIEHTLKTENNQLVVHTACLNLVTLGGSDGGAVQEGAPKLFDIDAGKYQSIFSTLFGKSLTMLLSNAIGGNAKAVFIVNFVKTCIGATDYTLQFALESKKIKNTPVVNNIETSTSLLSQVLLQLTIFEKDRKEVQENCALLSAYSEVIHAIELYNDRIKLLKKLFVKPEFLAKKEEPFYTLLSMKHLEFTLLEVKMINILLANKAFKKDHLGVEAKIPFEMLFFNLGSETGNDYIAQIPEHASEDIVAIDYLLSVDLDSDDTGTGEDENVDISDIHLDTEVAETSNVSSKPKSQAEPMEGCEQIENNEPLNLVKTEEGKKVKTDIKSKGDKKSTDVIRKGANSAEVIGVVCTTCVKLNKSYQELQEKYINLQRKHISLIKLKTQKIAKDVPDAILID